MKIESADQLLEEGTHPNKARQASVPSLPTSEDDPPCRDQEHPRGSEPQDGGGDGLLQVQRGEEEARGAAPQRSASGLLHSSAPAGGGLWLLREGAGLRRDDGAESGRAGRRARPGEAGASRGQQGGGGSSSR